MQLLHKHAWSEWEPLHKAPVEYVRRQDGTFETIYDVHMSYRMCLNFPCTGYILMDAYGEFHPEKRTRP